MRKVISSWSGGKESCLACYRAINHGYKVEYLLNFISKEYKRCCFHGIEARLIKLQSKLIGIPLVQREVGSNMEEYEKEFKEAVFDLKNNGIEGMVFGDVYLEEHKNWIERVCKDLGIQPIEPLWKIPPEKVIEEFINLGFKAIIVSCKADLFEEEFVGRYVDQNLLDELKERRICPCGENGEFHTFVVDGPIFQKRIEITKSQSVLRQTFWKHWFLDILEWRLKEK